MAVKVTKGNFKEYGAVKKGNEVTFTFVAPKLKEAYILLYDKETYKLKHKVSIPCEYRIGKVFSVTISGYKWSRLCYLLQCEDEIFLDTYAKSIVGREKWMDEDRYTKKYKVYGGFVEEEYDWQTDKRRYIPSQEMILYKLHMRGFTMHHKRKASEKGNYKGIISLLPELSDLGVTSLEFLPLYEFEEVRFKSHQVVSSNKKTEWEVEPPFGTNYWGYGEGNYFAPKASYFGGKDSSIHMKEMVDAIHQNHMEVIMEISFGESASADLIMDVLTFWMEEYHIDGFHLLGAALPMERIAANPYLSDTKIFYDCFSKELLYSEDDAKHLFVYNDDFYYPLRRLQHHMDGSISDFADQLRRQGEHFGFVNYAASNTGFCLFDVYSYGEKHNLDNGEENTDGSNYNCSHNHGVEGPTRKTNINKIRQMNARTALTTALLSQGIPMILYGDEVNNSNFGNNNPYCQDNEVGWAVFSTKKSAMEFREYIKQMIAFRKEHEVLCLPNPMQMNDYKHTGMPDLSYHGKEPWMMGIGAEKKAIGILYNGAYSPSKNKEDVLVLYNFYYDEEVFAAPKLPGNKKWFFVTNTGQKVFEP
ncbi:MAG: glycogen operon protein GlgX, partial [Lachnospiraceae bacterium]|nr:glycogen operon protein GlgX [Lachnospiraceae bacterium]